MNNLLKPSTVIWKEQKRTWKPTWKEQLRLSQQTIAEFALETYRKKIANS